MVGNCEGLVEHLPDGVKHVHSSQTVNLLGLGVSLGDPSAFCTACVGHCTAQPGVHGSGG